MLVVSVERPDVVLLLVFVVIDAFVLEEVVFDKSVVAWELEVLEVPVEWLDVLVVWLVLPVVLEVVPDLVLVLVDAFDVGLEVLLEEWLPVG